MDYGTKKQPKNTKKLGKLSGLSREKHIYFLFELRSIAQHLLATVSSISSAAIALVILLEIKLWYYRIKKETTREKKMVTGVNNWSHI